MFMSLLTKKTAQFTFMLDRQPFKTRDHDLREHIPHTWASSNDNLFQSNFSAWSDCEAILGKTPDWAISMT